MGLFVTQKSSEKKFKKGAAFRPHVMSKRSDHRPTRSLRVFFENGASGVQFMMSSTHRFA